METNLKSFFLCHDGPNPISHRALAKTVPTSECKPVGLNSEIRRWTGRPLLRWPARATRTSPTRVAPATQWLCPALHLSCGSSTKTTNSLAVGWRIDSRIGASSLLSYTVEIFSSGDPDSNQDISWTWAGPTIPTKWSWRIGTFWQTCNPPRPTRGSSEPRTLARHVHSQSGFSLLHDSARGSFGSGDGVILKLEEVLQWISPSLAWFRLEPIHPLNAKQSGWVGSGWMALTPTEWPSRPTRNFIFGNGPSIAPAPAPRRIKSTKKDPHSQRWVPSGWS
jgi:hypothetical protein